MSSIIRVFFVFAVLTVFCAPAFAFTPDDQELARLLQKNYGGLSSWEAEMTFPDYPGTSVHLWYARGKWRQEWKAGDTARAIGMNGSVVAACTADTFALSPMFVWMVPNPVETWRSWGVDNATRVYGFCGDSPCFMMGSDPEDSALPVIELHNEDLSPLLIRYNSGVGMTSVRYSDYKTLGGFRLPQELAVSVGGDSVLKASMKWIAVNRADDEMLYARDALDATPCATPPPPFDILRQSFRYPVAK